MKNIVLYSVMCFGIIFLTSSFSLFNSKSKKEALTIVLDPIPDKFLTIFKSSCKDCHASGGKKLAMSKLNFSGWDSYSPEKQAKKARAICNMLTNEKMPPQSYRKMHPASIPSSLQIDEICEWSNSMNSKE